MITSGESGKPWRVPFEIENGVERTPDIYTWAVGLVYKAMMAEKMGPVNPKAVP